MDIERYRRCQIFQYAATVSGASCEGTFCSSGNGIEQTFQGDAMA